MFKSLKLRFYKRFKKDRLVRYIIYRENGNISEGFALAQKGTNGNFFAVGDGNVYTIIEKEKQYKEGWPTFSYHENKTYPLKIGNVGKKSFKDSLKENPQIVSKKLLDTRVLQLYSSNDSGIDKTMMFTIGGVVIALFAFYFMIDKQIAGMEEMIQHLIENGIPRTPRGE